MANASKATGTAPTAPNAAPATALVVPAGNVVRTRTNRQTKTNVLLVAVGGKAHAVACMGPQGTLVTTAYLAAMGGNAQALASLPTAQQGTVPQAVANAQGHNTVGVVYASKALAKPFVYVPAAWCPACAAIAASTLASNTAAVATTALPTATPAPQA